MRHSSFEVIKEGERISDDNALDSIKVTYRPRGGSEWLDIASKLKNETISKENEKIDQKTNSHPHGTKYKPEMYRYVLIFNAFILFIRRTKTDFNFSLGTRVKEKADPQAWNIQRLF